jgi:hypothetical protein
MRLPAQFVEKDFWITELLRVVISEAAAADAVAIFKGGTSLSKGYRLIERFSEDVDILLVPPEGLGEQARHRILKQVCKAAAVHFGLPAGDGEVLQSETGIKRNVRFSYASRFGEGPLSDGVLLEMGVRGGDQPRTTMHLHSLAAEFALRSGSAESEFDEFEAVGVHVLASERTLVEKLSLLHGLAAIVEDDVARLALSRAGRHYYDVYKLLGHEPTIAACAQDGFVKALANDIGIHSRDHGWPCSPRPDGGFARSPAFDPTHPAYDVARVAYARVAGLVYGGVPTFEACVARVHANMARL